MGKVQVSKLYEYRIKSDIRKKLRIFQDLELPLLIRIELVNLCSMSLFTQNLSANLQLKLIQSSNTLQNCDLCAQHQEKLVGRKGFQPF